MTLRVTSTTQTAVIVTVTVSATTTTTVDGTTDIYVTQTAAPPLQTCPLGLQVISNPSFEVLGDPESGQIWDGWSAAPNRKYELTPDSPDAYDGQHAAYVQFLSCGSACRSRSLHLAIKLSDFCAGSHIAIHLRKERDLSQE